MTAVAEGHQTSTSELIEVWCDGCAEVLVLIPRRDLNDLSLFHYCKACTE